MTRSRRDGRTWMVWPDIHAPYHDPEAVAVACAAAKALQPSGLIIIGDTFDCWLVSEYPKVFEGFKRHRTIKAELDAAAPVLKQINRLGFPVEFLQGNHEFRLERYLAQRPELEGLVPTMRDLLPQGWKYFPYKRSLQHGKMLYSHDFGRHGVNAGRQGLQDMGANVTFGHTHKLGTAYVGNHVALNVGWLGDPEQIDYIHRDKARREYQQGFGIVDEDEAGIVWPQAVAIVNGTCRVRGRRVTA